MFPNLFPGTPKPKNPESAKNSAPENPTRRYFLLKSVASVAAVAAPTLFFTNDVEAAQHQPQSIDDLTALVALANTDGFTHPKADDNRIFNSQKTLLEKYRSGAFTYYTPKNPESSKYRLDFLRQQNSQNYDEALAKVKFETLHTVSDMVLIAEIEGGEKNGDSLFANGMVIIKKGTKLARRDTGKLDNKGKPIYNNYIYDCFNPVYLMACLPPVKKP